MSYTDIKLGYNAVLATLVTIGAAIVFAISQNNTRIVPSPAECEIYQLLYESRVKPKNGTISNNTQKYIPLNGTALNAPRLFSSVNSPDEVVRLSTSKFFGATTLLAERDLTECFDDFPATVRADLATEIDERLRVSEWAFSRVGTSSDNRHSIVYVREFCGNLCGYGSFYLFENQAGRWHIIATQLEWVT